MPPPLLSSVPGAVMITGGIDISVGSFVAMGCMMLAWMMEKGGVSAVPAVLIVLATGIVFGLVQGPEFRVFQHDENCDQD